MFIRRGNYNRGPGEVLHKGPRDRCYGPGLHLPSVACQLVRKWIHLCPRINALLFTFLEVLYLTSCLPRWTSWEQGLRHVPPSLLPPFPSPLFPAKVLAYIARLANHSTGKGFTLPLSPPLFLSRFLRMCVCVSQLT